MPRQRTDTFNHSLDQALQTLGTSMRAYEESLGVPFYQEDARFEHDGTALEVKFCLRASAEDNRA